MFGVSIQKAIRLQSFNDIPTASAEGVGSLAVQFAKKGVSNQLGREALSPYPDDLVIVTKIACMRGKDDSWMLDHAPESLVRQVHENLSSLGLEALGVVNLRLGGKLKPGDRSVAEPLGALSNFSDRVSCATLA